MADTASNAAQARDGSWGQSARETLRNAARNKFKRWIPAVEKEVGDPNNAMARLSSGDYVYPNVTPTFSITRSSSVFTIGSCFARNIEQSLINLGVDVPSDHLKLDPDLIVGSSGVGNAPASIRAVLNKYSTAAIRNELERALSGDARPAFIEIGEDKWIDPHLSLLKPATFEQVSATRAEVNRIIQMVRHCGAVMLTLGLTETWYDNETGVFLNAAPPMTLLARDTGRFVFHNMSVMECIDDLNAIVASIRSLNPEARIVMTVSPVPLNTTFTTDDAIVANSRSKSTLRAAVGEVVGHHEGIDYFPSYEMVTLSPRDLAYGPDQLHVRAPMVDRIMEYFVASYIRTEGDGAV